MSQQNAFDKIREKTAAARVAEQARCLVAARELLPDVMHKVTQAAENGASNVTITVPDNKRSVYEAMTGLLKDAGAVEAYIEWQQLPWAGVAAGLPGNFVVQNPTGPKQPTVLKISW